MQPITFRSSSKLTQSEFFDWIQDLSPHDLHRHELIDGFVIREPPAGWPHGAIEAAIVSRLATFIESTGFGVVFGSSQGFDLPTGDTLEPDVSFVSTQRLRRTKPERGRFLRAVPDLIFEILSRSTQSIDRNEKKSIYARSGVRELVLVDEGSKTFQCFRSDGDVFDAGRTLTRDDVYRSAVVDGFVFCVGDVFTWG